MANTQFDPAIVPGNQNAVPQLLAQVAAAGHVFTKEDGGNLPSRLSLLAKVRELEHALETPREAMVKQSWVEPTNVMAIRFGGHTGLWKAMVKGGDGPQKVADLAKQIGVDEDLLRRMMRHIAAAGYLNMTAPDEYTPNNFSKSMALEIMESSYSVVPPILFPLFNSVNEWTEKRGYTYPKNRHDTVYQVAHNTDLHWFEHLQSTPPNGQNFNNHMFAYLLGRTAWSDIYPAQEWLIEDFDTNQEDGVLLVDLAGGIGHYTDQFRARFPDAPGRLILEDLPPVLEQASQLHPRIEKVAYDFYTEQPIKGARAYFTHFVLHDWPDEECVKIVRRVRDAMKPGYSKFLVNEHVLPDIGHHYEQTALDLVMMTAFGSKERSASQWSELLEGKCGLKILNIWRGVDGIESVIECERQE